MHAAKRRSSKQALKNNKNIVNKFQQNDTAIVPTSMQKMVNGLKNHGRDRTSYRCGNGNITTSKKNQGHAGRSKKVNIHSPNLTVDDTKEEIGNVQDALECKENDYSSQQNNDDTFDEDVLNGIEEIDVKLNSNKIKENTPEENTPEEDIPNEVTGIGSENCKADKENINVTRKEKKNKRRSHPEHALSSSITCLGGWRNDNDNKALKESNYKKEVEYKSQLLMQMEEKRKLQRKNLSRAFKLRKEKINDSVQNVANEFESLLNRNRKHQENLLPNENAFKESRSDKSLPSSEEDGGLDLNSYGWNE